jgi:outer membrane protein
MRTKAVWFIGGFALAVSAYLFLAQTPALNAGVGAKVGVVSFRTCLENSKYGKKEQASFDEMKKQMETTLETKEKELNEMAPKFKDDYVDTLSPEAEKELKQKFSTMSHEYSQLQNQYYQMMNQANYQVIQKLGEMIAQASKKVAATHGIDIVFNEEATFHFAPAYDLSQDVVKELDNLFQEEAKKAPVAEKPALEKVEQKTPEKK